MSTEPTSFVATGPWDVHKGDGSGPAVPTKYAICKNDEVIGGIGLNFNSDVLLRTARFGYWLGEDFWYQGIMKAVGPAFLDWGWKTFGRLIRVEGGGKSLRTLVPMTEKNSQDQYTWETLQAVEY